jgi:Fibronectin type III domain
MVGGPSIVAGGITSKASAVVLAPNEPCSVLSAMAAGPRFCLKADPGDSRVQLTWSPSAPLGTVTVYYAPPRGFRHPAAVTNVTHEGALVTGLENDIGYTFWLVGKTVESDGVSATPVARPVDVPGAPAGLTAAPGDQQVTLSWDPPASDGRPSASTDPAFTAPTGLTATAGDTRVHLSWTAPTSDGGSPVTSYKIYVAGVPGVQELPAIGTAKTTDVTVTRLRNRAVYYFMVTAVNTAGNESPPSTEVSAEPTGSAPGGSVSLSRPIVPPQLIALLAAVGAMAAAGAFTLIRRGRRLRSQKGAHTERSDQQTPVASDVRAVPNNARPDVVSVRDTGTEPSHTVRLEPHPGVFITTIKEGRP